MTTKAERIEAMAEAIGEIDITYDKEAPWLLKDDWTKEIRVKVAQAAIAADPMTEDVKRLVEAAKNLADDIDRAEGSPELDIAIYALRKELKKWSGE